MEYYGVVHALYPRLLGRGLPSPFRGRQLQLVVSQAWACDCTRVYLLVPVYMYLLIQSLRRMLRFYTPPCTWVHVGRLVIYGYKLCLCLYLHAHPAAMRPVAKCGK